MATPKIPATNPTVVPAAAQRVYDQWKVSIVAFEGTGVGTDTTRGSITFRKARTLADGGEELGPPDDIAILNEGNLQALAAQYPKVRAALDAVAEAAIEVAMDRGLL